MGSEDRPIAIRSTIPDPTRVPDLAQVDSLVLSEGPRSKREMVRYKIVSRNSGELKGTSADFRNTSRAFNPIHSFPVMLQVVNAASGALPEPAHSH